MLFKLRNIFPTLWHYLVIVLRGDKIKNLTEEDFVALRTTFESGRQNGIRGGYAGHLSSCNIFIDRYASMCEKLSINAKSNERNEFGNITWVLNLN